MVTKNDQNDVQATPAEVAGKAPKQIEGKRVSAIVSVDVHNKFEDKRWTNRLSKSQAVAAAIEFWAENA